MIEQKEEFLKNRFIALLRQIPTETHPAWGKMTLQQMIEHFADSVRISSGKTVPPDLNTPEDQLAKYQEFLMSDRPFKENTINPLLPELPAPVRNKSSEDALQELQKELDHFFSVFNVNEHLVTLHPVFGELNYQMNVQLLYKHAVHHLRQFGVDVVEKQKEKQAT
ncbi:MAG: hypothetical protein ACM3VS_14685 [Candidatus Dadabacteria bacterium]